MSRSVDLDSLTPPEKGGSNTDLIVSPSCKVCTAPQNVMTTVNYLIATGANRASIMRIIEPINETLDEKARISYRSVETHSKKHLPYESAAIKRIMDRRRNAAQQDMETGAGLFVEAADYAEVMMNKGFAAMASGEVNVSPSDGLKAAEFLHKIEQENSDQASAANSLATLNRIIQAVRAVVPEKYWQAMMDYIDEDARIDTSEASVITSEASDDEDFDEDDEDDEDY